MRRNILYFSCHEILEFDDLRMFTDAGHRVFSLGAFTNPRKNRPFYRSPLPVFYDEELFATYEDMKGNADARLIPEGFIKYFDVVIVNHYSEWIHANIEKFADVPVILRTVGQSRRRDECAYAEFGRRIAVVRYSAREADIPGFARTAEVIRFAKYPSDFAAWTSGDVGLTFHNAYGIRDHICYPTAAMWQVFHMHTSSRLYGRDNDSVPQANGVAPHEVMTDLLRTAAFYFYVWTHPPSYTLSLMEAMLAGCPILAPSAKYISETATHISENDAWSPPRYEVPELLQYGAGISYDTINEAIYAAHWIQHDHAAAKGMSAAARTKGIEMFGVDHISPQWDRLFDRLC